MNWNCSAVILVGLEGVKNILLFFNYKMKPINIFLHTMQSAKQLEVLTNYTEVNIRTRFIEKTPRNIML